MPEINLLHDTQQPEAPKKPEEPRREFAVTDPSAEEKPGIGGIFRSLFRRRPSPSGLPPTVAPTRPGTGKMSLGRTTAPERILSETKKASRPAVIPLPDEEGGYNVNLLTEDLVSTFNPRQKMMQLGFIALGAAAVVLAMYAGLRFYASRLTQQVSSAKQQLEAVQSDVQRLAPDQAVVTSTTKKLSAVQALVDRHVRWTRFFAQLERYTLPSVTYGTSFSGDITGAMTLSASTSSFDEVAKQYLVFQQAVTNHDFISSFAITGATLQKSNQGDRVNFTVTMTILPELLENTVTAAAPVASTPTP